MTERTPIQTYRIDDPNEGSSTVKAADHEDAADRYFQHSWSGDSFDHATAKVTDVATGESYTFSCHVRMEPQFELTFVKNERSARGAKRRRVS